MKLRRERWLAALALGLVSASCGEDLTVTPVRNLERPSDMDFVCLAAFPGATSQEPVRASAMPMSECYFDDVATAPDAGGMGAASGGVGSQREVGRRITFGLFTNTARSEVGAIDMLPSEQGGDRLIDLDRRQPGYNMVPVGTLPERLAVSDDGCTTVTANRGSCDLSVIDNTLLLAPTIGAEPISGATEIVRRLRIKTGDDQPFWGLPAEVAMLPSPMQAGPPPMPMPPDTGDGGTDGGGDAPVDAGAPDAAEADATSTDAGTATDLATGARQVTGGMCAAGATAKAVVTFPGCDLVALIDLGSGKILSSARLRPDGTLEDAGQNPVCSAECPGGGTPAAGGGAPDGGSGGADGGAGAGSSRLGLAALAVHPETNTIYVGANRSAVIAALAIDRETWRLNVRPDLNFTLAEKPGGVTRIRLSRDPYRMVGGRHFVGRLGPFMYAFAQDGSVRVLSLSAEPTRRHECDVHLEFTGMGTDPNEGCQPIGSAPRHVLDRGPGLRPPAVDPTVGPALPVDIAFTNLNLAGTGFLLTSRGDVYHIGLGYLPTETGAIEIDSLHQVRPISRNESARSPATPTRNFSETSVAFPTRVSFTTTDTGPFLASKVIQNHGSDPTFLYFPKGKIVPQGRASVRWEGILPYTQRNSGKLSGGTGEGKGSAGSLTDEAATFCTAGVEAGDVVAVVGCDEDRDCDPTRNEVCYRAAPGARGACLPRSLVADDGWARLCQAELGSRRRYEVKSASRTVLQLKLKPDEVPRPSIAPCSPMVENDAACQPDAAHRADPNLAGDRGFQCVQLPDAPPRCLKPCGVRASAAETWQPNDELCRAGFVCADMGNPDVGPVCVEGPPPRPECNPGDTSYQVQAGRGFTVASTGLTFYSRVREGAGGACVPDPERPAQFVSRLPLAAPACTSIAPGVRAEDALASIYDPIREGPGGNPCLFRPGERASTISGAFENAHFRLVLNNLDTYIGDAAMIDVNIEGGFRPTMVIPSRVSETPNLGVRIVTGPMKARTRGTEAPIPFPYLFVVDQSRTTSLLSRGKIMRINPYPYLYSGGHFDSLITGSLYPIQ